MQDATCTVANPQGVLRATIGALIRYLPSTALAGLLAGCGGASSSQAPMVPTARSRVTQSRAPTKTQREGLLYVSSSANGNIAVYSFPRRQLVGMLSNLNTNGSGECVDAANDVFITTYDQNGASTIYEYTHGGTTPIATLADPGRAWGCAVDTTTGNLAVSNRIDYSSSNPYAGHGDVALYTAAQGPPTMYYDSSSEFAALAFCGYDGQGNLYLSAVDANNVGKGGLLRFSAGSNPFSVVSVNAPIYGALSVQWDGTYVTLASTSDAAGHGPVAVYRLNISGNVATVAGTTTIIGAEKGVQTWIQGPAIIGITGGNRHLGDVSSWRYPAGGVHQEFIKNVGQNLFGVTISKAPN